MNKHDTVIGYIEYLDCNGCVRERIPYVDAEKFKTRIHPCTQNRKRKGLGNIIISAPLQSVYDVQIGVIGSQQNNRNPGRVFLDLPEQLKPTAIRQIDIQQDQGYTPAKQLFFCRF